MAKDSKKMPLSFNIGVSKGQSRKEKVSEKKSIFHQDVEAKVDVEKDYILAAEGSTLKSKNEKVKEKELVIPMIKNNNWRLQDKGLGGLDEEAANEILNELRGEEEKKNDDLTIPLLMQNRLPGIDNLLTEDEVYAKDVKLRPTESSMEDYEQVPVSSFGSALLRGMGWKEGQPIGLTNKGLAEPIEYIPRFKGLGLGAERREEDMRPRKRKLGETNEDPAKRYNPIVEKDGRVRHVKGIDEKVKQRPKGYSPGNLAQIDKGSHKGLYGKIVAVDVDNARVTIRLAISDEMVTISQYQVTLVDEDEYRRQAKVSRVTEQKRSQNSSKSEPERLDDDKGTNHGSTSTSKRRNDETTTEQQSWLTAGIRVRIISDKYKKGKYYNKKVNVLDVVSRNTCTCTDDNRILEGLRVTDLETVIPKDSNANVLFVDGKYKGQIAKIIDRNQAKCRATVQLLSNKHVTKTSYDNISEFVGEIPDELFVI